MTTNVMQQESVESTVVINKATSFQFLDDICSRSVALFRNPCFIQNIGAKICARVFGEDQEVTNEIEEFTKTTMLNLRTDVQLHGLVSFDSYMESDVQCHPPRIYVHGEWNYHALKANEDDPIAYRLHVLLGTIKMLHELFHCLTPSFITYRNKKRPDLKPLLEIPPEMGRKVITNPAGKRGAKSIRLIGDMGFAMEELLFHGQRLFHHAAPDYHFSIEKLYLQDYDMKTFTTTNYDVNIISFWAKLESVQRISMLEDISEFSSLTIQPPISSKKSSIFNSPRKSSSNTLEQSSPAKMPRHVLESPSHGGLFADDDDNHDESEDEDCSDQLLHQFLPLGRKS